MENEASIIERLNSLEKKITPMAETARSVGELREELAPRVNEAVHALIRELADIEADFQLEDLLFLIKKILRNTRNFTFALDQMKNIIDLVITAEPLLKSSVPLLISELDQLERNGVFRLLKTSMDVLARIGTIYSQEDLDQIGNGMIRFAGMLKELTRPETLEFFERAVSLPGKINLSSRDDPGPLKLMMAMRDPEARKGLGVLVELTKALGMLKP